MNRNYTIDWSELRSFCLNLIVANGFPRDKSIPLVDMLIEADARDVHSHGVARLNRYIVERDNTYIEPDAEYQVVTESSNSLVVDAQRGIGQYVAKSIMEMCIRKAKTNGICLATIRNSNHFGMAGLYAESAATHDMIGISMTNSYPLMVPTFGRQALLGSNPISVAIPGVGISYLLDMATSVVSRGKLEVYQRNGKEIIENWAVDSEGAPKTRVDQVLQNFNNRSNGGLLPLGGSEESSGSHKGFGLALLVDLLCAGLSQGSWSNETYRSDGGGVCHFLGAIDLSIFGDPLAIKSHVEGIVSAVVNSQKAENHEKIYYHGEKEHHARKHSIEHGVTLESQTVEILAKLAGESGIVLPSAFLG